MNDDLSANLERLMFRENAYGGYETKFEGIHITALEHPFGRTQFIGSYVGERNATEFQVDIPDDATVPRLAQIILDIHEQCKGWQ